MKKFFLHILCTLLLGGILLGIILRVFNLAGHTIPVANINGDALLMPGSEGVWVKGGFGEIKSHYMINKQGWNSTIDYDNIDYTKINVALIGDSYIEGLHVDVENSIGRIMESLSSSYRIYEFGRSAANIVDFAFVYNKWIRNNYDYVFILVTDKDLLATEQSFMGKGEQISNISLARKIYNKSYILRYLNINQGLLINFSLKIGNYFNEVNDSSETDEPVKTFLERINTQALDEIGYEVVYLYESGKLDSTFIATYKCQQILHKNATIDFGFDNHWSLIGRINCAKTMDEFIKRSIDHNII